MPPIYTVHADVVDIRANQPQPTDRLLVDSNVWAWAHYFTSGFSPSGASIPQVPEYSDYLQRMRSTGAIRCGVLTTFAELAHLIEQSELEGYSIGHGSHSLKEYRHNVASEHARVLRKIERVWGKVESDSELIPLTLDFTTAMVVLALLGTALVDGYDLFQLVAMTASGVTHLLSDDGDFCTVAGITLFTANPRVIAAARTQGKLIVR